MAEPEIKTMQKDIEELKEKTVISGPPEKLPVVPVKELPGAPLPSEPIISSIPLKPIEPPKPSEPTMIPSRQRKFFRPIVLVIVVLLVGAGVYYWWTYEAPISLIRVETTETIKIKQGKEAILFDELKKKAASFQEKNTFQRILLKKIGKEKDYFLSAKEIFEVLGINLLVNIAENLKEDNTLFLYSQEQGKRLGIIIKVSNADNLKNYLNAWEGAMVNDLKPFFFGEKLNPPAIIEFKDNVYKETNIRYLNFTDSNLAIDYAVVRDYLVITTSKESMFGAIDRILE